LNSKETGVQPGSIGSSSSIGRLLRGKRRWALAALGGALVVGAGIALGQSKPSVPETVEPVEVHAEPIAAFDKTDTTKSRFGKLTWRGGLVLTSPSPSFGGFSALALDTNGRDLLALTDAGAWMRGVLTYDGEKPVGLRSVRMGPVIDPETDHDEPDDRDSEGVAIIAGSTRKGEAIVSFERTHRIVVLDLDADGFSAVRRNLPLPEAIEDARDNRGLEGVTLLRGGPYKGSIVAFAERLLDESGNHTGWIWIDGKPQAFHLEREDGFDVTDTAALPNGGLLVLERRFRVTEGVKTRLRLIRSGELKPGALVRGERLLDATLDQEIDNMEGLAVFPAANDSVVVTMISDDNFNRRIQRTVLLQFALDGADLASAEPR
jgi:hypothetical protein